MSDFLLAAKCMFDNTWSLLSTVQLPGTGISFSQVFLGTCLCVFAIWLFKRYAA